ncbi:MAG: hypothetical protein JO035_17850 [Betaproteobacteria bacterium]|nr:hypothetical protein [Betaproteobacteria bacterium]
MKALVLAALACATLPAVAQEKVETRELVGRVGSRPALIVLHSIRRSDTNWRVTGEYIVLPTLARRYLEGERSPERGFTSLREGASAILFGHPSTGELRGTYRDGVFKGTRYGPGGQEREQFEFSEEFPSMEGYSASVACEAADAAYSSHLSYVVDAGKLQSLEWSSQVGSDNHSCRVAGLAQQPLPGGLKAVSGACAVTFRDVGEAVKVSAENCASACGSGAYLEPMLVDRRGGCTLLRPRER